MLGGDGPTNSARLKDERAKSHAYPSNGSFSTGSGSYFNPDFKRVLPGAKAILLNTKRLFNGSVYLSKRASMLCIR